MKAGRHGDGWECGGKWRTKGRRPESPEKEVGGTWAVDGGGGHGEDKGGEAGVPEKGGGGRGGRGGGGGARGPPAIYTSPSAQRPAK